MFFLFSLSSCRSNSAFAPLNTSLNVGEVPLCALNQKSRIEWTTSLSIVDDFYNAEGAYHVSYNLSGLDIPRWDSMALPLVNNDTEILRCLYNCSNNLLVKGQIGFTTYYSSYDGWYPETLPTDLGVRIRGINKTIQTLWYYGTPRKDSLLVFHKDSWIFWGNDVGVDLDIALLARSGAWPSGATIVSTDPYQRFCVNGSQLGRLLGEDCAEDEDISLVFVSGSVVHVKSHSHVELAKASLANFSLATRRRLDTTPRILVSETCRHAIQLGEISLFPEDTRIVYIRPNSVLACTAIVTLSLDGLQLGCCPFTCSTQARCTLFLGEGPHGDAIEIESRWHEVEVYTSYLADTSIQPASPTRAAPSPPPPPPKEGYWTTEKLIIVILSSFGSLSVLLLCVGVDGTVSILRALRGGGSTVVVSENMKR